VKVLFLTHCFIRKKGDLSGVFLFDLARELVNRGTEICVVAPHEKGLPYFEKIDGIKIYRFRYAPVKFESLAYTGEMHELVAQSLLNKFIFLAYIASFLKNALLSAVKERANIIHAHWWVPSGMIALGVSKLSGKPYIVTSHGSDVFILRKFAFLKPLARIVFENANAITVVSNSIKSILIEDFGVSPHKISVFPMPFDLSTFYPTPVPKIEKMIILSIGRLIELKGYNYLIEAMGILKKKGMKIKLTIIGEGTEEKSLKEKIQSLGLNENIEILPFKPKADLNYFYNLCDVFVLSSVKEGLGVVLLEAMSCGKPVIGTDSGGIPDIIKDGETGLLVPEKDPEALAGAIERLLKDKELANRLAENGYKYVLENFTGSKIAEKMAGAYSEVIGAV